MLIGIDGNEANVASRVGSNLYAHRVLSGLSSIGDGTDFRIYLKQPPLKDMPPTSRHLSYTSFGPGKLWTQWRLPLELYRDSVKPDVFFTPGHYAPRFSPVPSVITILDLAFLYFPEAFQPRVLKQLKSWTNYSVRQARHILAISEQTKRDVVNTYAVAPERITVTYLGSNLSKPPVWSKTERERTLKKYGLASRYFLFVGTRQPRKNLDTLVRAFNRIHSRERDVSLVIVGKVWHQFSETEIATHPQIITPGYLPDSEVARLMLGSEALVMPSFYEGFGLPVLEAMSLGTLVACSNVSSLPEITGKTPLLFDPHQVHELEQVLTYILNLDPQIRKKMVREAKMRSKHFSWDRCVRETYNVLQSVASNHQLQQP